MNNADEMLKNIIEKYQEKRDEIVEKCIKDAVSAFDGVIKTHNEDLRIKVKRLSLFNRWLVILCSSLYKDTDTSIAAIEQDDTKLNIQINIFEPNGLDNNVIPVDSTDSKQLAGIFGLIYKSNEFQVKLRIYNELSSKPEFDMTIFATELHRYTPADLYLRIKRDYLRRIIDSTEVVEILPTNYVTVHSPYKYSEYNDKYGIINGAIFKIIEAKDTGEIKIKFIA